MIVLGDDCPAGEIRKKIFSSFISSISKKGKNLKKRKTYMDHSATTPLDNRVLKEMLPYFSKKFGNPSSLYSYGMEAKISLENTRERLATLVNAKPEEIIFTSGGSESDNLALRGVAYANRKKGNHIITSEIEHPAVLRTCEALEKEGFRITYVPVDNDGIIRLDELENSFTKETILVSVMHANNEIGTIQPIEKIAELCKEKEIYFHTDAVQSFGKLKIDVSRVPLTMFSLSAHKIYGPKGVGAIFIRKGTKLTPQITGGPQELSVRAGTENLAGFVGLVKAAELMHSEMEKENERLSSIRDHIIKKLSMISDSRLNGHKEKRLSNNINMTFRYIEGESLLTMLDMAGVAASTGSACSSASLKASHVLLAIGLKHPEAHGSLRLTLGRENTKQDADFVISKVPEIVSKLRKLSPLNKNNF